MLRKVAEHHHEAGENPWGHQRVQSENVMIMESNSDGGNPDK